MRNITNLVIASILLFTQSANAEILCVFNNPSLQCLRAARDVFSVPYGAGTYQGQLNIQGGPNVTGPYDGGTWRWNFPGGSVTGRHWCANSAMTANGTACFCQITRLNGMSCLNAWRAISSDIHYQDQQHCRSACARDCSNNLRLFTWPRLSVINMTCVACDDCATECGAGWTAAPANTEMYQIRTRSCPNRPRGSGIVTCQ